MNRKSQFVFSIPVIAKNRAKNYDIVLNNLENTLISIKNSTDNDFLIYVCSDEPINIPIMDDLNVINLLYSPSRTDSLAEGSADKYLKRRHIASDIRRKMSRGEIDFDQLERVLIFGLDADDLVHKDLVSYSKKIVENLNSDILIDSGYRYDVFSCFLEPVNAGFYEVCGSCFIGRFSVNDLPLNAGDDQCAYSLIACVGHSLQGKNARAFGRTVETLNKKMVIYLINHSASLRIAKTKRISFVRFYKKGVLFNPDLNLVLGGGVIIK